MRVLVACGAGCIGSHTVKRLRSAGHEVLVCDDLSAGHRDAVIDAELIMADICDTDRLSAVLREHRTDAVVHFAARIEVGESVRRPDIHYHNNVHGGRSLLEAMRAASARETRIDEAARRPGDPARLIADPARARTVLDWSPTHELETIVASAWRWEADFLARPSAG